MSILPGQRRQLGGPPSDCVPDDLAVQDWDDVREREPRLDDKNAFGHVAVRVGGRHRSRCGVRALAKAADLGAVGRHQTRTPQRRPDRSSLGRSEG